MIEPLRLSTSVCGTPETNLRVCGAISHALEPLDFGRSQELFNELKKLYSARSNLVHGNSEPSLQQANVMRDHAIDIGVQAMRRLYTHPELLNLDSSVRGSIILLGAMNASPQVDIPALEAEEAE